MQKTRGKSTEACGKNAQSSTETDVWIKRTKQDFEQNEKQWNADNGAGQVYPSTALRCNYLWTSILVHGVEWVKLLHHNSTFHPILLKSV